MFASLCFVAGAVLAACEHEGGCRALSVDDVLESAALHYPEIVAAAAKVEAARGEQLASRGAFDPALSVKAKHAPLGYYEKNRFESALSQATPLWGLGLQGGYRYGDDWPLYNAYAQTAKQGEVFAKAVLPLLRNRSIDTNRLGLQTADLDVLAEEQSLAAKRLTVLQKAGALYWKWVGAGALLEVERRLLNIANERQRGLESQVFLGNAPPITLQDNERLVVGRSDKVLGAERDLRLAALDLSMFYRGPKGDPTVVDAERLPPDFGAFPKPPTPQRLEGDLARIHQRRPEVSVVDAQVKRLTAQLQAAENQLLPQVDLQVEASQDIGDPVRYGSDPKDVVRKAGEVNVGLVFYMPVPQRKARGKTRALRAKLESLQAQRRLLTDQIKIEAREAFTVLQATHAQLSLAKRTYELTLELERAERRKFELGNSDVFLVSLREDKSGEAATELIKTQVRLHLAHLDYQAAVGMLRRL